MAITRVRPTEIADELTSSDFNSSYVDGTTATPSLRTLGTGAQQSCSGDDSRLSDSRVPSGSACAAFS